MKRSPSSVRVPWESFRWMTGPRRDVSAALFVGWTPGWVTNVQSAGQILWRLFAKPRWCLFWCFPCGLFEERAELELDGCDLGGEPGAVLVLAVAVPGVEEVACELEALLTEMLLGGEPFGVEAEVSLEVTPAGLAAFGVEEVVGPPAVGAADAVELGAEQFLEPVAVTILGDPEDRRLGGGRGPERAVVPGGDPAGLVDVDRL